jgi:hypothetical protein
LLLMTINPDYIKAGHPETTSEELRALSSDTDALVRRRVAENPNCPGDVLTALSDDSDSEVRIAVGSDGSTPKQVLQKLARDEDLDVCLGMADDLNLPKDVLQDLADHDNPYISDQARRALEGLALEEALKESGFIRQEGETAKLGEILVAAELLKVEELNEFLRVGEKDELPLGRVLVQSRTIPRSIIILALNLQTALRRKEIHLEVAIDQLKKSSAKST